jgi:regulator of nucleoside diphosphate kinase
VSVNCVTCASCGSMLGVDNNACRRCGAAVPPARHPLYGAVARTPRHESQDGEGVVVTARDFMLLEELARLRLSLGSPAARGLLGKLERCRVVPPDKVAADVVTLESRVVFRADGGAEEECVLVHPDGHTLPGWSLPVTAPRGLAMLGLRVGSTAMAERRGGGAERIDILSVTYQPEEATRRRRAATAGGVASASPVFLRRPAGLANAGEPPHDDLPPAA